METWWTSRKQSAKDAELTYERHSSEDQLFHERIVNDVNANPKSTWKVRNELSTRRLRTLNSNKMLERKLIDG